MMRSITVLALTVLAAAGFGRTSVAEPAVYSFDPDQTAIAFRVDHLGYGPGLGRFLEADGSFVFDEEAMTVSDIVVEIDAKSVFSDSERRDGHLKSKDFLNADTYPMITYVGTAAEATSDTTGKITGDLTILDVTMPVTLDVTLHKIGPYPFGDNYVVGFTAQAAFNRSDFGMSYAVDNGWVGDEVEVMISVQAIRQ